LTLTGSFKQVSRRARKPVINYFYSHATNVPPFSFIEQIGFHGMAALKGKIPFSTAVVHNYVAAGMRAMRACCSCFRMSYGPTLEL